MKKLRIGLKRFLYLVIVLSLSLSACQTSKGGRKQPKKGPIPCPIKDC